MNFPLLPRSSQARILRGFLCLPWALGCSDGPTKPVDPGDEPAYQVQGEPEVDIGFYVEQLYEPLSAGDPCFVIYGLQGGTWTMPSIRLRGLDMEVAVEAEIRTLDGETVGEVRNLEQFVLAPDGWLEVQAFPIPVAHEAPNQFDPIDDLFGEEAELTVRVTDDADRMAERSIEVVLTEG